MRMGSVNRSYIFALSIVIIFALAGVSTLYDRPHNPRSAEAFSGRSLVEPASTSAPALAAAYGRLPLTFERNDGQSDPQVRFTSHGSGYALALTSTGAIFEFGGKPAKPSRLISSSKAETPLNRGAEARINLLGARPGLRVSGVGELPGRANYFIGNDRSKWRTNVPTYSRVKYAGVYPGIDLVYYGNQRQLEYDFAVSPGADPNAIALTVEGAAPTIGKQGDLILTANGDDLVFRRPHIYQDTRAGRQSIEGQYALRKNRVSFQVAAYDRSRPLIIDPVLSYSTLLGGDFDDSGNAIAIDSAGDAYITGFTCSDNFPVSATAFQKSNAGGSGHCSSLGGQQFMDVFVTKLNPRGTKIVYSTYLGGSGEDIGAGIAVDSSGNAYVDGVTNSVNFPTTAGAMQTTCAPENVWNNSTCTLISVESTCGSPADNFNGFVTKLNPTGSALIYSTYMGGTGNDGLDAIAIDAQGEAYVAGHATSEPSADVSCGSPPNFFPVSFVWPTTATGFQTLNANIQQPLTQENFYVVFSKLTADGSGLAYSSDLSGPGTGGGNSGSVNTALGIATDSTGNAYLTGYANDSGFPVTTGAFQCTTCSAPNAPDAFVAKFNPTLSGTASLIYSTRIGGNGGDFGYGIGVDSAGNAYVGGSTGGSQNTNPSSNFPTTTGAFQASCPTAAFGCNGTSGWITKFNPAGSQLVYSTYLGGPTSASNNQVFGIAVGPGDDAFVTGYSNDPAFPLLNSIQTLAGVQNVIVSELNPAGSALSFSTFLGGSGVDAGNGIATDSAGNIFVSGETGSTNGTMPFFPTTTGAFQTGCGDAGACNGFVDGFVSRISGTPLADLSVGNTPSPSPVPSGTNLTYTIVVTNAGPSTAHSISLRDNVPAKTTFVSVAITSGSCSAPPVGGTGLVSCSGFNLSKGASATETLVVRVNALKGGTITDKVQAQSMTPDPNPANNSVTVMTSVS